MKRDGVLRKLQWNIEMKNTGVNSSHSKTELNTMVKGTPRQKGTKEWLKTAQALRSRSESLRPPIKQKSCVVGPTDRSGLNNDTTVQIWVVLTRNLCPRDVKRVKKMSAPGPWRAARLNRVKNYWGAPKRIRHAPLGVVKGQVQIMTHSSVKIMLLSLYGVLPHEIK
jgi:hypothetical protein